MARTPHDPTEVLAVVDENDNEISRASRRQVQTLGLWHREVYVYLINSKGELLLQKRKDNGRWDHSAGGHFRAEDTYLQGAVRELAEELGVKVSPDELAEIAKIKRQRLGHQGQNNRFAMIYMLKKDITKFNLDPGEVLEVRYFSSGELVKLAKTPELMSTVKYILEKFILKELK
jgi:isopentenyl-diphosphate Delta-isomerase